MKKIVIVILLLASVACRKDKYNTGHFQDKAINFSEVNSEYDDYNSTAPNIYYKYLFHFSSNRNSSGGNFDIIGKNMYIDWSKSDGDLIISTDNFDKRFDYLTPMFEAINTSCNELGPFSIGFQEELSYTDVNWIDVIMYASDCNGDYDIHYVYSELPNITDSSSTKIHSQQSINFINTDANELYPSFYGEGLFFHDAWGVETDKIEKIIYCSDAEGVFNIYELEISFDSTLIRTLNSDNSSEPEKLSVSSGAEDKCPYVNGKLMVLASNRPGGYGGFDLYYSTIKDGKWTEPVNFGDKINTEYDEYRPITLYYSDFDNNLMIFSSNRPGGKGGFDLYHIGIKQMIK